MSAKFSMIRAEILIIAILYSVKINSIEFSTGVAEFENVKTLCSSDYQVAGKDLFNSCQPENCRTKDLKEHTINHSMVDDTTQIVWINAFVVRSPVMEYKGCYKVNVPTQNINNLPQQQDDTDNDVLQCSRFCKSKGYSQKEYVILLQEFMCFCIKKTHFEELFSKGQFNEVPTSNCSKKCPGDKRDRCGPTDYVSAYEFTDRNVNGKNLGSTCFYTDLNRGAYIKPKSINCFEKLKFKCQTVDAGDGFRNVKDDICFQWRLDWYSAEKKCRELERYLPTYTPSNKKCGSVSNVDEDDNWHNTFTREKIIWNTEKKPRFSHECLAIEVHQNMTYKLLAADCKQKNKALCVKKSQTETTTIVSSQQETTTVTVTSEATAKATTGLSSPIYIDFETVSTEGLSRPEDIKMTSSNSKDGLYIGPPLALAGLIVSVIIIVLCVKRRRKRKTNENENEQNMSAVYYSTVPDEVTLKKDSDLPLADDKGACLLNETDVYNHLGDTDPQNHSDVTGPVYDHTGLQDNDQYDISIISEKRTNKDGDDLNHYDLMQVSADINSVYDETSTARKTNGDKSIDSVDIYDHAKQTENDYDTTDTQKRHEQREHVNEPTYDQSGSCENLREPTYDQSGPCEHLTDPMYDQSGPLEADIYEKCETKQSSTDEQ